MNIGIFFQSGNTIEKHKLKFYYNIFTIFLHFISIIISFKTYKEMRVIFMEEYESSNNGSELEEYSNKDDGWNKVYNNNWKYFWYLCVFI